MKRTILLLLIILTTTLTHACPISPKKLQQHLRDAKVNKAMSPLQLSEDNISEEDFNKVVAKIREHYTPIFKELGKTLNVYSSWTFPMNNAFATEDDGGSNVYFFGLFTKNRYMKKDTFLFVACHEIGHHLGGFPKSPSNKWSSIEGQADYFAATKCYRELLKNDPENASAETLDVPGAVKTLCKNQHPAEDDYRICLRGARAAEDVGKLIDYMLTSTEKDVIYLTQPEPAPVTETSSLHPAPLCRAHGILQASLCNGPSDIPLDDLHETVGACHEKNGDTVGHRSQCWFKPSIITAN